MPFPRTWSEELVAEWLQLKGYFIEVGVPVRAGPKGSRVEVDIVGVRFKDGKLEIYHIEVGTLPDNPKKSADMIRRKFSQQNNNAVKNYCKEKLGLSSNQQVVYNSLYVAVWGSEKALSHLKQQNLPVQTLSEFIKNEIKPTIDNWKKDPPHKPKTTGSSVTLPEGMWLLRLVDSIFECLLE